MQGSGSERESRGIVSLALRALTELVLRAPWTTLTLCVALAIASSYLTATRLQFKTSRADLISPEVDYQRRWLAYIDQFGDASDIVVVVEGPNREAIGNAVLDLGRTAEQDTTHFRSVFYQVDAQKLRQKGLQYLHPDQLQEILNQLGEYGPLLRGDRFGLLTISKVIRNLGQRVEETNAVEGLPPEELAANLEPLFEQINRLAGSLDLFLQNQSDFVSPWPELVRPDPAFAKLESRLGPLLNAEGTMGFIKAQPVLKDNDFSGATGPIDHLRELIRQKSAEHPGVSFGLTGIPVLENDEMRESQRAMVSASTVSFIGVAVLMIIGFRALHYPIIAQIMLTIGIAWAFGFATLAVGHLNILSVSFTAMLIGLGIDYATIYLMRYLELRHHGWSLHDALLEAVTRVGPGTLTAACSTAIAFAVALLTDFVGIAELGLIAAGGILLAVAATFLLVPALVSVFDRRLAPSQVPNPFAADRTRRFIARHPLLVMSLFAFCVGCLAPQGFPVRYDCNLLNLQARGLPSVEIQDRIFKSSQDGSILFAVSLADSPAQVLELRQKFEKLPSVHHVHEIASMLPAFPPEDTRLMVDSIRASLSELPAAAPAPGRIDPAVIGGEFQEVETILQAFQIPSAVNARVSVSQFLDRLSELDGVVQANLLRAYHVAMTGDLLKKLKSAYSASSPEPVSAADFPPALARRFISEQGKWLLQIHPKEDVWEEAPLSRFVAEIRSVDPDATGTPVQTFEATRAIYRGYVDVGIYALIIVVVMLLLDLRSFTDAALAMLPPLVGGVMTVGVLGLVGVPLNPANLIILPLIVGIGVDGGVHVLHDFHQYRGSRYRISPSTFSAIVLNQATTVVGFGSLMMAAHRGLFSLGLVLSVGVISCMLVAVILLPAMLVFVSQSRRRAELDAALELTADPAPEDGNLDNSPRLSGATGEGRPLAGALIGDAASTAALARTRSGELQPPSSWLDSSLPPATILGTGKNLPPTGKRTEPAPLSAIGVTRRTAPAQP
jgi:uncharacterized protein